MSATPIITAIKPDPRRVNMVKVMVDGKVRVTLRDTWADRLGLRVGMSCEQSLLDRMDHAQQVDRAYRDALNRLNRRQLTAMQLRRKLEQRDHPRDVADQVIDELIERDLLNDRRFGQQFIEEIQHSKPAGPARLRAKLRDKGLDNSLIEQLLSENRPSSDQQRHDIDKLIQKKANAMRLLDPRVRRRRLGAMLTRRGFDFDVIEQALSNLPEQADGFADELDGDRVMEMDEEALRFDQIDPAAEDRPREHDD